MNFQTMSRQRKFILIAAAAGIISVFLPWVTISAGIFGSQSISGFHGLGIVVFLAFAGALVLALVGDQTKALENTTWMLALIAGVITLIAIIISFVNASGMGMGFVDTGHGIGVWLALICSIAVTASAWVFRNPGSTLKTGLDSFKQNMQTPGTAGVSPPPAANASQGTNKIAELEKLIDLKNKGHISEEEYQQLKSKFI